jgi:hypothetical protein
MRRITSVTPRLGYNTLGPIENYCVVGDYEVQFEDGTTEVVREPQMLTIVREYLDWYFINDRDLYFQITMFCPYRKLTVEGRPAKV